MVTTLDINELCRGARGGRRLVEGYGDRVVGGSVAVRHNLERGIRSRTAKAEIREVGKLTPLRQGAFKPTKESGRQ